jgi:hypothetical protein
VPPRGVRHLVLERLGDPLESALEAPVEPVEVVGDQDGALVVLFRASVRVERTESGPDRLSCCVEISLEKSSFLVHRAVSPSHVRVPQTADSR